jgi:alanyl-tRNA synthetase
VVSVGIPLEDILKNVKDERWGKISIEFCGGTHVRSTADIKDLVIIEESGIAKGIRRIIAVTGEDAHTVQRVADEFSERLHKLEGMLVSPKLEQEVKSIKLELDALAISAVRKSEFRQRVEKITRDILDHQKKMQKEESKKALDAVTEHFKAHEKDASAVIRLPVSGNSKIVADVIKHIQSKMKEKSVYVLAADGEDAGTDGRVVHGCYVSPVSSHASSCPIQAKCYADRQQRWSICF